MDKGDEEFKRDTFCFCFALDHGPKLIGIFTLLDLGLFIFNVWNYFYCCNESLPRIIFVVLYIIGHIPYLYTPIVFFRFGVTTPDTYENRLFIRRMCLLMNACQVYTLLLIFLCWWL